ncbi:MAG: glycosyltransferase family 2 protein [Lentisphaerae bacterium]|nr:glycosyltransferase family 2 protein [Lentisphaerota bacterium]
MLRSAISIIVPCFNEEACLADVLSETSQALAKAEVQHEFIVIDDGSTDDTHGVAERSGLVDTIIRHRVNRGYGSSIKAGLRKATYDDVLIMDGDGQHPPESLLAILEQAEDYDMVIGSRQDQGSHHWRIPGKYALRKVAEMLVGMRIPDVNSGLRLMRKKEALEYMHLCSDQFSFSTSVTLAFLSDRMAVRFVPVAVRGRQGGASRIRLSTGFATFMLILRTIGTFNPLKIFMPPTIILFLVGLTMLILGVVMSGNVNDAAVLCLVSSMLLFCFGLLADQMALLRRQIKR